MIQILHSAFVYQSPDGEVEALRDVSFDVQEGEFCSIVGPSGCGKSTLLSALAGLERLSGGSLELDGEPVCGPSRKVGFMPQRDQLFEWRSIWGNVTLGLTVRGENTPQRQAHVRELLERYGLADFAQKRPSQLSGGMRRRCALIRTLAAQPKVLLLDEPLGALDLRLRKDMQIELKRIQQRVGITFVYVTHDQEEALTMSDTVVVMDKGRIQQIGTPEDIYNEPKNAFVADFIGESNILNGVMVRDNVVKMYGREFPCVDGGFAPNEPVDVVIRPEDIDIVPVEQGQLVGTVTSVTFKGMQYDIIVDFRGFKWLIQTTDHSPEGARIGVKIDPDGFHIMKKSEYSGQFGDYSSYSEEYEELADASLETDEEESGDEE